MTDIVLPSKLCNILASARPVVAAAPPTSQLAMILPEGSCGSFVHHEDGQQMAEGIVAPEADRACASTLAENGGRYAEANLLQSGVIGWFESDALTDDR